MAIRIEADIGDAMRAMKRALREAEGGKLLQRECAKRLRRTMDFIVSDQRSRLLSLPSKGHSGESMRQAISRQTKAATRWSGRNAGISIVQRARGMPRNFNMAGRMFNRDAGWSPTNLGGESMHQEIRPAQWFDGPVLDMRVGIGHEVRAALEETAAKIARSAHHGR